MSGWVKLLKSNNSNWVHLFITFAGERQAWRRGGEAGWSV
jgi:hypothetical protein